MGHERSETLQRTDGQWVNVYGRETTVPGRQLPGTPTYRTEREASDAAAARSRQTPRSAEDPLRMQRVYERMASEPRVRERASRRESR